MRRIQPSLLTGRTSWPRRLELQVQDIYSDDEYVYAVQDFHRMMLRESGVLTTPAEHFDAATVKLAECIWNLGSWLAPTLSDLVSGTR